MSNTPSGGYKVENRWMTDCRTAASAIADRKRNAEYCTQRPGSQLPTSIALFPRLLQLVSMPLPKGGRCDVNNGSPTVDQTFMKDEVRDSSGKHTNSRNKSDRQTPVYAVAE